jgi:uncharacterized protein YdcH (DUF465 family)
MQELLSKFGKPVLYAIIGLVVLYGVIWITTRKPQMPTEYKAAIDSLTKANAVLIERQKQLDNDIKAYEAKVEKVDFEINNIKEKTTIVKEYHREIIERTNHYDAGQVDSFFKSRYNY